MGTRQRHCALRDLCAWLHFAPVPAFLKNIPKDLDHTFPTRYASSSPLSSLLPPQTGSCSLTLHYTVCLRTSSKGEQDGRSRGMPSSGCAAQIQKAWKDLAETNDDNRRRQGKLTTTAAVGNLTNKKHHEACRPLYTVVAHGWPVCIAIVLQWQFSHWFCRA